MCLRKHNPPLQPFVLLLSIVSVAGAGLAQTAGNLPESAGSTVGYPSVEAALGALREKPGVTFRTENEWLIAEDEQEFTVWSFAPSGHPAYPTVLRRSVVERDGMTYIDTNILCEADKVPCDNLVLQFQQPDQAAQSTKTIDVTRTGDREFVMTLRASSRLTVDEAQMSLVQAAIGACAGLMPSYGKYSFEAEEPLETIGDGIASTFVFVQEFACTSTVAETTPPPSRNVSDSERERLASVGRGLTDTYFANLENGPAGCAVRSGGRRSRALRSGAAVS